MEEFGLVEDQIFTMDKDQNVPDKKFRLGKRLG